MLYKIIVMTEFIYWLGDFFYAIFGLLEIFGNLPNWGFIVLAFALLGWWMKLQKEYNAKAAADPNQLK